MQLPALLVLAACAFISDADHARRLGLLDSADTDDASDSDSDPPGDDLDGDGYTAAGGDCHDDDPTAYPGSHYTEVPGDGTDQDCDGLDACVDLTCDGYPDLFVPGPGPDPATPLSVYRATGTVDASALSPLTSVPTYEAKAAAIVDLDGDGYLDLIVGGGLLETGSTPYAPTRVHWGGPDGVEGDDAEAERPASLLTTSFAPTAYCTGDVDLDGDLDLVAASGGAPSGGGWNGEEPSTLFFNDAGAFTRKLPVPSFGASACVIVDLNHDSFPELVLGGSAAQGRSAPSILYQGGTAPYGRDRAITLPSDTVSQIIVEDLDKNGDLDLVLLGHTGWDSAISALGFNAKTWVHFNPGGESGSQTMLPVVAGNVRAGRVVDLDEDGHLDLVVANNRTGDTRPNQFQPATHSRVLWGRGAEGFGEPTLLPVPAAYDLDVADLDGDGTLDLAFTSRVWTASHDGAGEAGSVIRNLEPGARFGEVTPERLQVANGGRVRAVDLDQDGRMELVFAESVVGWRGNAWDPAPELRWFASQPQGDALFPSEPSGRLTTKADAHGLLVTGP
jgi:hypothetical protein